MSTKRAGLPLKLHHLWDAIERGTGPNGPVDFERLMAIVTSLHKMQKDETNRELDYAIKDGLILPEVNTTKNREELEIYKLPDMSEASKKGEKDWYCFHCHQGGKGHAVACEDCPRIYHLECLPDDRKPQKDLFVCPACHIMATKPSSEKMNIKQKLLNTLIEYSCDRFVNWLSPILNSSNGVSWAKAAGRDEKDAWRYEQLVYFDTDLTKMSEKARNGQYVSLEEYQVDCETLAHSMLVYFGGLEQVKAMGGPSSYLKEVMHDIKEIELCHDCFRQSNEQTTVYWFCLPCTKPHQVVWAKQSGYPYWPAKVMKQENNKYDVRYFGGNHERGLIDAKNIQPIDTPIEKLKIRKTASWNEAYDELQKFLDIAENPEKATSLPATRGGKATPKGNKRAATSSPSEEVQTKKIKKSLQSSSRKSVSTPNTTGRGRKSTASNSSVNATPNSSQLNGVSSGKKKLSSSSKTSPLKNRRESANINMAMSPKRLRQSSKDDTEIPQILDPEDLSFIAGLDVDGTNDDALSGTVSFSDEEADDLQEKASDDAVSSSVNDKSSGRNVYVQTTASARKNEGLKDSVMRYIANLKQRHADEMSGTKKKQWCYNCEREAIYHCCWNTAYCSIECQQVHWSKEHKRLCRRKKQSS